MDNGWGSYRRFLNGDQNGMAEIITAYKDGLMLYLLGYTKNIYIAEEIMEDVFVKLVVKRPRFTEKYSFKTWLYTIGRNTALDYLRHNKRYSAVSAEDFEESLTDEQDLEKSYIREEQKILLHRAMNKLKRDYRQVLYMSYFEDMKNAEIAAVMKKSRRQIENLIYCSKNALKKELEKEGFIYEEL